VTGLLSTFLFCIVTNLNIKTFVRRILKLWWKFIVYKKNVTIGSSCIECSNLPVIVYKKNDYKKMVINVYSAQQNWSKPTQKIVIHASYKFITESNHLKNLYWKWWKVLSNQSNQIILTMGTIRGYGVIVLPITNPSSYHSTAYLRSNVRQHYLQNNKITQQISSVDMWLGLLSINSNLLPVAYMKQNQGAYRAQLVYLYFFPFGACIFCLYWC